MAVLAGGTLAASLDLTYAILVQGSRGRTAEWTLQLVGSGLLGDSSFASGFRGALTGLVAHFAIMFVIAWLYVRASQRWPDIRRHPLVCGAVYGVAIFVVMNFIVLPLSAFPLEVHYSPRIIVREAIAHILLVGVPIALVARKLA